MTHSFPTRRSSDLSLPPAPRSKLVRSVRSRPSVLTSPWLKKQLWTPTTALPRFGSRASEHGAPGIGVGSSPLSMLISCCELNNEIRCSLLLFQESRVIFSQVPVERGVGRVLGST